MINGAKQTKCIYTNDLFFGILLVRFTRSCCSCQATCVQVKFNKTRKIPQKIILYLKTALHTHSFKKKPIRSMCCCQPNAIYISGHYPSSKKWNPAILSLVTICMHLLKVRLVKSYGLFLLGNFHFLQYFTPCLAHLSPALAVFQHAGQFPSIKSGYKKIGNA